MNRNTNACHTHASSQVSVKWVSFKRVSLGEGRFPAAKCAVVVPATGGGFLHNRYSGTDSLARSLGPFNLPPGQDVATGLDPFTSKARLGTWQYLAVINDNHERPVRRHYL